MKFFEVKQTRSGTGTGVGGPGVLGPGSVGPGSGGFRVLWVQGPVGSGSDGSRVRGFSGSGGPGEWHISRAQRAPRLLVKNT